MDGGDSCTIIWMHFISLNYTLKRVKMLKFMLHVIYHNKENGEKGFPGGAVVKNPPASAGDTGSSPGLGRSHMPRSS